MINKYDFNKANWLSTKHIYLLRLLVIIVFILSIIPPPKFIIIPIENMLFILIFLIITWKSLIAFYLFFFKITKVKYDNDNLYICSKDGFLKIPYNDINSINNDFGKIIYSIYLRDGTKFYFYARLDDILLNPPIFSDKIFRVKEVEGLISQAKNAI